MKQTFATILLIILIVIIVLAILPFIFFGIGGGFGFYIAVIQGLTVSEPPPPQITYGEFPFALVYEINGEEKVIEDTLICEYAGVEWVGDFVESYRKWKTSFKSGNERIVLLNIDEKNILYFLPGSAGYYMGEYANGERDMSHSVYRNNIEENPHYAYLGDPVSPEDLFNLYGIRLIS